MNSHYFDVDIATTYGVPVAIVLNHIAFWIRKNHANNKHYHDGRFWTYNSIKAFQALFPYWTFKQMRTVLDKLKESGLIMTGNYNATSYDQTIWYAFTDEGLKVMGLEKLTQLSTDTPDAICPNGQIKSPERANQIAEKGKPIPDNKPDNKNHIKAYNNIVKKTDTPQAHPSFSDVTKQSTSYNPDRLYEKSKPSPLYEEYMRKLEDKKNADKHVTRTGVQSEIPQTQHPSRESLNHATDAQAYLAPPIRRGYGVMAISRAHSLLEKIGLAGGDDGNRYCPA